jgi:hypothetical protein
METLAISELQSRLLRGNSSPREHPEYHTARKVYNGMIDK